jgi:hypothetical protein
MSDVPVVLIFTGFSCGMLLTAVGLVLLDGFRQVPGLPRAVQVIGWLAGAMLLIGLVLVWRGDRSLPIAALRLILMAAVAAPPGIWRRCGSPWSNLMLILPAPILAGIGLFWASRAVGAGPDSSLVTPVEWAVIICGGLGIRALGEVLSAIAASISYVGRSIAAAYVLLTLLVGGTALVNLWQQGTVGGGAIGEGGVVGAWLVWSVAWLGLLRQPRLRTVLTGVAALLLISLAFLASRS